MSGATPGDEETKGSGKGDGDKMGKDTPKTAPPASAPPTGPPAQPPPTAPPAPPAPPAPAPAFGAGYGATVDSLLNDPELQQEIPQPPQGFRDRVAQLFNSLVPQTVDEKSADCREILQPDYHKWLAYYLVKARASKEVNLHPTYIEFIDKLRSPGLMDDVTSMTYECLRRLLKSVDQAVQSTSHRTVLKNLGFWLGQITLARNKAMKSKQLDLKQQLLDAFEHGRLTAVLPLVCKVLEGVQGSKVFKIPNPWTTAVLSLLSEIHDVPNLRTHLMFEVEVLCKHLGHNLGDLKRSQLLKGRTPPANSPDLSSKDRSQVDALLGTAPAGAVPPAMGAEGDHGYG